MRAAAFVAIILLAAFAFAAETYTSEYAAGDWLKVTRTSTLAGEPLCLDSYGVTDACASSGSIQPNQGTSSTDTKVELSVENVGAVDRTGVDLSEDLSYVPTGARITYGTQPSSSDGRIVKWSLGSLAKGATLKLSYVISARIPPATLSSIPDVAVAADPALLSLSAPESMKAGEKATVTVEKNGKPIPNAIVVVTYPDGVRHPLRSDLYGVVKFTAADEGKYTYSLEGYSVETPVETEVGPLEAVPAAPVAAAVDTSLAGSIMGVLPILAALFAIAVIALILYNFFTSRREEDEYMPQQPSASTPSSGAGMAYTQKFSFGTEEQPESRMQDRTHDLVESRKRRLAETAAASAVREEPEEEQEAEAVESTATGTDMENIISELEHKARKGGEVATEDEEAEVEKTISELEAIREKLRAMRAKGKGAALEEEDEEEGPDEEEEPEEKASKPEEAEEKTSEAVEPEAEDTSEEEEPVKRPASRKVIYEKRVEPKVSPKPAKKGMKTRFGNRGVKKK